MIGSKLSMEWKVYIAPLSQPIQQDWTIQRRLRLYMWRLEQNFITTKCMVDTTSDFYTSWLETRWGNREELTEIWRKQSRQTKFFIEF